MRWNWSIQLNIYIILTLFSSKFTTRPWTSPIFGGNSSSPVELSQGLCECTRCHRAADSKDSASAKCGAIGPCRDAERYEQAPDTVDLPLLYRYIDIIGVYIHIQICTLYIYIYIFFRYVKIMYIHIYIYIYLFIYLFRDYMDI